MKRHVAWVLLVSTSIFAASCIQHTPRVKTGADLIDNLNNQTLALDRFMARDGVDEDGDASWKVVDPDDINTTPEAHLIPYCAAVWVTSDTMLTAFHCIEDEGESSISRIMRELKHQHRDPVGQRVYYSRYGEVSSNHERRNETTHHARVYAIDPENDLALIKTDPNTMDPQDEAHSVAQLTPTQVRPGDDLHIVGHVSEMWWTYTHGYVGQVRPYYKHWDSEDRTDYVQVNAPVWHGDSAAALSMRRVS
jgi:hypothetical protein